MRVFAAIVVIGAMIAGGIWRQVYLWDDCRKVGHTQLYCLLTMPR